MELRYRFPAFACHANVIHTTTVCIYVEADAAVSGVRFHLISHCDYKSRRTTLLTASCFPRRRSNRHAIPSAPCPIITVARARIFRSNDKTIRTGCFAIFPYNTYEGRFDRDVTKLGYRAANPHISMSFSVLLKSKRPGEF